MQDSSNFKISPQTCSGTFASAKGFLLYSVNTIAPNPNSLTRKLINPPIQGRFIAMATTTKPVSKGTAPLRCIRERPTNSATMILEK